MGGAKVAYYKDNDHVRETGNGDHKRWSTAYKPGEISSDSGIYRCQGCGTEITHIKGQSLPPRSDHTHTKDHGKMRWLLLVRTKAVAA